MSWHADDDTAERPWIGPTRPYSLVKEILVVLPAVMVTVLLLAVLFSSPDKPSTTLEQWARYAPRDFVATAAKELAGTSRTARYGPPYNNGGCREGALSTACATSLQQLGFFSPQRWAGIRQPIDAQALVVDPLLAQAANEPALAMALARWTSAGSRRQRSFAAAYGSALATATFADGTIELKATPVMGPVPQMLQAWLRAGRSGAIDAALLQDRSFFATDRTKPLLLLEDGGYFARTGTTLRLQGGQWGQMNEVGSWPGAWWLVPYTVWYNVPPANHSQAADLIAFLLVAAIILTTVFLPFLPGVRSLPRALGVYRLIWRDYYSAFGRGERAP